MKPIDIDLLWKKSGKTTNIRPSISRLVKIGIINYEANKKLHIRQVNNKKEEIINNDICGF